MKIIISFRFQLDNGAVIHHSKEVMPKYNNSHKHSKRKVEEQLWLTLNQPKITKI